MTFLEFISLGQSFTNTFIDSKIFRVNSGRYSYRVRANSKSMST